MCFGTCRKIRQNILTTTSSFHAQNTIPSPSKNNLRRHDHNAFSLEETTTHMISRKVLDKSATQDKSATLHMCVVRALRQITVKKKIPIFYRLVKLLHELTDHRQTGNTTVTLAFRVKPKKVLNICVTKLATNTTGISN